MLAQHKHDLNVILAVGHIYFLLSFECNMDVMYKEYLYKWRAEWVIHFMSHSIKQLRETKERQQEEDPVLVS